MPLKLDRQKRREMKQASWLLLDLAKVFLVLLNLGFIIFDTMYSAAP